MRGLSSSHAGEPIAVLNVVSCAKQGGKIKLVKVFSGSEGQCAHGRPVSTPLHILDL